jgi:hypothetical protein
MAILSKLLDIILYIILFLFNILDRIVFYFNYIFFPKNCSKDFEKLFKDHDKLLKKLKKQTFFSNDEKEVKGETKILRNARYFKKNKTLLDLPKEQDKTLQFLWVFKKK